MHLSHYVGIYVERLRKALENISLWSETRTRSIPDTKLSAATRSDVRTIQYGQSVSVLYRFILSADSVEMIRAHVICMHDIVRLKVVPWVGRLTEVKFLPSARSPAT
jgi:hypothetical protein